MVPSFTSMSIHYSQEVCQDMAWSLLKRKGMTASDFVRFATDWSECCPSSSSRSITNELAFVQVCVGEQAMKQVIDCTEGDQARTKVHTVLTQGTVLNNIDYDLKKRLSWWRKAQCLWENEITASVAK